MNLTTSINHKASKSDVLLIPFLVLATALGPLAMSSFIPTIPFIQNAFQVEAGIAQLTMSLSMVSMAIFSLAYGALADRFGRRPVLLLGVLVAAIGSVLCFMADSIGELVIGRALQAAGATSGLILTRVIVYDIYGEAQSTSVLGYITAAMAMAPLLGPIYGGLLIEFVGWRSVFLGVALLALGLFLTLMARLPETKSVSALSQVSAFNLNTLRTLRKQRDLIRFIIFAALTQSTFMVFLASAPHILLSYFEQPASRYGLYFAIVPIGFAIGGLVSGRLGKTKDPSKLIRVGAIGSLSAAVIAFSLTVASHYISPWLFFGPAALIAFFTSLSMPGAQVKILGASKDNPGIVSGIASFSQLIVSAVAAQIVGEVIWMGPKASTTMLVIVSSAALVSLLWPSNWKPEKSNEPTAYAESNQTSAV